MGQKRPNPDAHSSHGDAKAQRTSDPKGPTDPGLAARERAAEARERARQMAEKAAEARLRAAGALMKAAQTKEDGEELISVDRQDEDGWTEEEVHVLHDMLLRFRDLHDASAVAQQGGRSSADVFQQLLDFIMADWSNVEELQRNHRSRYASPARDCCMIDLFANALNLPTGPESNANMRKYMKQSSVC